MTLDGGPDLHPDPAPHPPAKNFWSVDVYDTQTRSLLQTDNPYPSVMSLGDTVAANDDGPTPSGSVPHRLPGTRTTGPRR